MRPILFSLLLVGCVGPRSRVVPPSTMQVVQSIYGANASVVKASASVRTASQAMVQLEKTALPVQRPALGLVRRSLTAANSELIAVKHSLAKAEADGGALQERIDGLADDLGRAQDAERKSRNGSQFWRAWAFRLGVLSLALAIWTLRRPIAAFFGGFL